MKLLINLPTAWLGEAAQAYAEYVGLWQAEELARVAGTDEAPEPVQDWLTFVAEYAEAELDHVVC